MRSVIRTALGTASDDSSVRGGLHGYKAAGHAREKPNLPICAYEIGDLEIIIKKKVEFSALSDAAGVRVKWGPPNLGTPVPISLVIWGRGHITRDMGPSM